MNYLLQIAIIATISFLGELLNSIIPLPIPGSIYGLVLMLLCLQFKIVKLKNVKSVGDWLIAFMPVMFVGPTVGLINSYTAYKDFMIPVIIISIVTTLITMAVSGLSTQWLIRKKESKTKEEQ